MIKIIIVEDETMLKDTLENMLNKQDDMDVIGVTDSAANSPHLCKQLKPDLLLMDIVTKNNSTGIYANGIHYTAKIRREEPQIKVIIMTGYPDITFIKEAQKARAHSFFKKTMGMEHLLYIIRSTMKGMGIYPGPVEDSPFSGIFSETETVILRMVCQGMSRYEMASYLDASEAKITKVIRDVLDKTGFDSISKFAIYMLRSGYIVQKYNDRNAIHAALPEARHILEER